MDFSLKATEKISFELLETLLLNEGKYFLLDKHIQRMLVSASFLGIPISEDEIRAELEKGVADQSAMYQVRLLLDKNSKIRLELSPYIPFVENKKRVTLAKEPVAKDNFFLLHKTTFRKIYDQQKQGSEHMFDVLMWNEQGELTEFTIGNLVMEINMEKWTPPLSSGLLPGTMRAELIERREIKERVLTVENLAQASKIWLVNSLRGWVLVDWDGKV